MLAFDACYVTLNSMIKTWKHKGLKLFFQTGSKAGIMPIHEKRLKVILQRLNASVAPEDMDTPGMDFHALIGNLKNNYSVTVSGNWRVIFKFEGKDAIAVNYLDYH
jgi:toxin HigB-1